MANIFDTAAASTIEPEAFTVGDFGQWKRPDLSSDYPPTEYNLTYVARLTNGGSSEIKIVATNDDGVHLFIVPSSESEGFNPGVYHWQLEVEQISSGNRTVLQTGEVIIKVDLDINNTDPRTHAEIMVSKIETILQGKADSDVSSYSVAGRSLTKMTFQELIEARDYYKKEVVKYRNDLAVKNGRKSSSTIKVRF
jgi:5-hydroxyisourate hydrolase-like protein (transthyretin family)